MILTAAIEAKAGECNPIHRTGALLLGDSRMVNNRYAMDRSIASGALST